MMRGIKKDDTAHDGQKLLDFLQEKKYDHIVLYHKLVTDGLDVRSEIVNYVSCKSDSQEACDTLSFESSEEEQAVHQFSMEGQMTQNIELTVHTTISFCMFPEVLKTNCTANTNKENHPFFVACGQASDRKVFRVIEAFFAQ
jgi:hypothetical protein